MSQVHAPYHFVPLSQWVYSPDWAHLVSHDHPFQEGLSGTLQYELTNQTPLLVGGEQARPANQPARIQWARDPDGKPLIPGSSLKGMIRNVLEIATFAKFRQVDDSHFAYRDISSADSRYASQVLDSKTLAYWLRYDTARQGWTLREARYTVLFTDDFNRYSGKPIHNEPFKQSAKDKYRLWPLTSPAVPFALGERTMPGTKGKMVTVPCATKLGAADAPLSGYPVFAGSRPGKKEYRDSRLNFNYCFYDAADEVQLCDGHYLALVHKMFAAHDEELVDYLKKHPHPALGIPLFVKQKAGKVLAMGFAQMPKMLYDRSIGEIATQQQPARTASALFDFPELLFGTLAHSGFSLKSRVSFGDALCQEDKGRSLSTPVILGQPKASYLGAYLEQKADAAGNASGPLSQYDANSRLSGWKRYPAQTDFSYRMPPDLSNKGNVQSQLELMAAHSRFAGKIVFHNLKAEELGALIWALTPDGEQAARFHHGLGHGKSLGAGAVQFRSLQLTLRQPAATTRTLDELRAGFVTHMERVYPASKQSEHSWADCAQIRHLLAFGDRADNEGKPLEYMQLSSKDDSVVTYTASMKGRNKQVLPTWRAQGSPLSRAEAIAPPAVSPGCGRLRDLLQTLDSEGLLSSWEKQQQAQAAEAAVLAAAEAFRGTLSPLGQQLYELRSELEVRQGRTDTDSQNFRTGKAPLIDELIRQYLAATPRPEQREAQMLYDLATDTSLCAYFDAQVKAKDLSKKQKERHQARKQGLQALADTFGLQHSLS